MKPDLKKQLRLAGTGLAAAFAVGCATAAETMPKEGTYDFTACFSGVATAIKFSKTARAFSYETTGAVLSNRPGGLFDKNTFRCIGTDAVLNGKHVSSGVICEAIAPNGDKRLWHFTRGSDGKLSPENIAGTGEFDGMVVNGKLEELGPFPAIKPGTFQACNHQTGTYKLK